MQREEELKHPVTAHNGERISWIGQEKDEGYHCKLCKNTSCMLTLQTAIQQVEQSQLQICFKGFFIRLFDFTLGTSLPAEGNDVG